MDSWVCKEFQDLWFWEFVHLFTHFLFPSWPHSWIFVCLCVYFSSYCPHLKTLRMMIFFEDTRGTENKNICKCFYAVLPCAVTLMSVKGQSHISFLPWRINNVVILAETGMSEPRAGSTLLSNLFFPKGPSSLVLFDSFIVNVLQSCCPGLP